MIELTLEQKMEVQMHFLRRWLGAKRRAKFDADKRARQGAKRYDMRGVEIKEKRR